MRFHLAHIVSGRRKHWLRGYEDVARSVGWALTALGHTVSYGQNEINSDARNIVFGGHELPEANLRALGRNTIFYNLDRLGGADRQEMSKRMSAIAGQFEVWDADAENVAALAGTAASPPKLVPVGYAPNLDRIERPAEQDIDALICALPSTVRLRSFQAAALARIRIVFACGLYGETRDNLISRAKIVLSIGEDRSGVLPIVGTSLLLANRKLVVSMDDAVDLEGATVGTSTADLVATLNGLLEDDARRREQEERGHAVFKARDTRAFVAAALGG